MKLFITTIICLLIISVKGQIIPMKSGIVYYKLQKKIVSKKSLQKYTIEQAAEFPKFPMKYNFVKEQQKFTLKKMDQYRDAFLSTKSEGRRKKHYVNKYNFRNDIFEAWKNIPGFYCVSPLCNWIGADVHCAECNYVQLVNPSYKNNYLDNTVYGALKYALKDQYLDQVYQTKFVFTTNWEITQDNQIEMSITGINYLTSSSKSGMDEIQFCGKVDETTHDFIKSYELGKVYTEYLNSPTKYEEFENNVKELDMYIREMFNVICESFQKSLDFEELD